MIRLTWIIFLFFTGCYGSGDPEAKTVEKPSSPVKIIELSQETKKKLTALGYFDRAPTDNPEKRKVTKKEYMAFDGINLYSSRNQAVACLVDMEGNLLHKWSAKSPKPNWMHVKLLPDGDLMAISKQQYLARYDWNSNLVWKQKMKVHHDLAFGPDRNLFVLASSAEKFDYMGGQISVLDNSIISMSSTGKIQGKTKLFPLLHKLISRQQLNKIQKEAAGENTYTDVFHANSIQVINKLVPSVAPVGSFLLSVREINRIVILNKKLTRILWSWGNGELEEQHHATLLDNGNIMVFDNGIHRRQSRIIEVNPVNGKIKWSYTAPGFFTRLRGAAQKLPNDNVLITESDKGHVFEVTPDGKVVWEFWNPDVTDRKNPTRAIIYRMIRYKRDYLKKGLLPPAMIH